MVLLVLVWLVAPPVRSLPSRVLLIFTQAYALVSATLLLDSA